MLRNLFYCPLCSGETKDFFTGQHGKYYKCQNCQSVLLHPNYYVTPEQEKDRYLEHNNDVNDPGYQNFVSPIVNSILKNQNPKDDGLDYGAGTGPVIAKLLHDRGYKIVTYDPLFDKKDIFNRHYDYIVSCEVIEHFHNPYKEFQRLKKMLKSNGLLYCMTDLYDENIDFKSWHYKDDQTHVIFYHTKAIEWIQKHCGFSKAEKEGRLLLFYA
ncbi:MAG: class I SAM-dependent methyltransferase [Bacteroidales bacterium]